MAQTGYTPIVAYHSTTASAAPAAGDLAQGELALNVTDKKIFTKDGGGNVVTIGEPNNASTVIGPASATADSLARFDGTTGKLLKDGAVIGVDVQAYDADTAKTDVAQNWTGTPRATPTTDNDLSFSMNAALDFNCTPTAGGALTFTNITQGQRGCIYLVNGSNYAITAGTGTKVTSTLLATISVTGEYWLSYWSPDGTIVLVTAAGDFA